MKKWAKYCEANYQRNTKTSEKDLASGIIKEILVKCE